MALSRKLFAFFKYPENCDRSATHNELRAYLGSKKTIFDQASRLSFCPIGTPPEGLPPRPDDKPGAVPEYDAVIIAGFAGLEAANKTFQAAATPDWFPERLKSEVYLASPTPVIERMPEEAIPAIKYLALNIFHDDLPDSAAQRSWAQHAKLAGIVHTGAGRYFRNWVEAKAPDDLPVRGIVEIDFVSVADLTERYFGIPGGMDRIIQDVGHFLRKGIRLYMPEEKLR